MLGIGLALPGCNQIINFPAPTLASLSPSSVTAGQPTFTLTLNGKGFVPNASLVEWNGNIQTLAAVTVVQSVNVISVSIPYGLIQNPGQAQVSVFTPQPGGGITQSLTFTINPRTNPIPQITSLSPSQLFTGAGGSNGSTITILGKNFVATGTDQSQRPISTVDLNGSTEQATFVNSTNLQLTIPASNLAAAGPLQISVVNPADGSGNGGGTSNPVTLNVVNPVPIISTTTPSSIQAGFTPAPGNPYPTLTVTGMNLVANSYITINGGQRTTVFSGPAQLTTQFSAADLVRGGYIQVAVVTPGPGGGTSNSVAIAVNPLFNKGLPTLVDVGPNGVQANSGICGASCAAGTPGLTTAGPSTDQHGRFIAFASVSNNLAANYVDAASDIFLRDTCLATNPCTAQTSVISVGAGGAKSNGASFQPSMSSDASQAAFTSVATNLVTNVNVPGGFRQVYWAPTCQGTSCAASQRAAALVSISADGTSAGNGDSYDPAISPDGRYVAFVSLATNLVSNAPVDGVTPQVFLRDTCGSTAGVATTSCTPATYLISSPDGTTPGNAASILPAISNSGQYVAFESAATNLGTAAPNPNGAEEIFVRAPCLGASSSCTASTTLISTPDPSATAPTTPADGASIEPSITADGRFVAFASTATNLGAGATPAQQIYLRDTCVGAPGSPACTPGVSLISAQNGAPGNALSESPSISTTGQFVAFASSASNLGPAAPTGIENIYVRNTCIGSSGVPASCTPGLALASIASGAGSSPADASSLVPSISADGHTVAFLSLAGNLVIGDTNGLDDIFLGSTSF